MKVKNYFITALILLLLPACEDRINEPITPENVEETGFLLVSLDVSHTRTEGSNTEVGNAKESVIKDITIVLTDASGIIKDSKTPTVNNGVTEVFTVPTGEYYVYALVNKPSGITVNSNENILKVVDVVNATEATNGYKDGVFFMTNRCNTSTEEVGIFTEVTSNNTMNNPATVSIQVDRVAVKIEWDKKSKTDFTELLEINSNIFDEANISGFALLNCKKNFNLIQKWSTNNYGNSFIPSKEVLETPEAKEALLSSNYYYNIGTYTDLKKDANDKVIEIIDKLKDMDTSDLIYATENRPTILKTKSGLLTSGMGEATGVIFKVNLLKNKKPSNTFFTYEGMLYTSIKDINNLPKFKKNPLSNDQKDYTKIRARGVNVYENGVVYYTYFIRDPNKNHQLDNKDYFGVFRNSVYKLSIKKFSGLGDDVPGGRRVDPSKSDEAGNPAIHADNAYIKTSVDINPWVINSIKIEY